MSSIYNAKYVSAIDMLNQAHPRTPISAMLEKGGTSVFLKDETEWENLIFFGSVYQSVGAKKERSQSVFVLTDGMHRIWLSKLLRGRVDREQVGKIARTSRSDLAKAV